MKLSEVLPQLAEKFPPECHKERDLPGGGTWWYVPWQTIRERLNTVCPDAWEISYDEPKFLDKYCYVTCTLIICGVSRRAIGSAPIELLSKNGRDMSRGNPIERAVADAFKNAAESFQIAAYLDEQSDDRTKREFVKYMQRSGNGKPVVEYAKQTGQFQERPKPTPNSQSKPFGQERVITPAQVTRFQTIARQAGYTTEGAKQLLAAHGFNSSKDITPASYDTICTKAADPEYVLLYNEVAQNQKALQEVAG